MQNAQVFREIKPWKRPYHTAFALVAKTYLKLLPNVKVIAITGSVGKTLTQNAIHSVLSQKYRVVVGDENLDPTFRIPETILKTKPWDDYLVLEYGVEHPGDMDYYISLVKPKYAILTLIAPTHTKYFQNEQGVFNEKIKLIKNISKNDYALLNSDDPFSKQAAKLTKANIILFGEKSDSVKISHFVQNIHRSKFRLHYAGQKATVSWKVVGVHQLLSARIAASLGIQTGLTLKQIAKGLSAVKVPEHRLNLIRTKRFDILDDTYNSSPKAAIESINTLIAIGKHKTKVAILGEMKDLGALSSKAHILVGQKIAASSINYLITVGAVAGQIAKSDQRAKFKGKIINVKDCTQAAKNIEKLRMKSAVILVKGSRHAHLERIVLALQGKSTQISCYHCGYLN